MESSIKINTSILNWKLAHYLVLVFLFAYHPSPAQYQLPESNLLVKNKVKIINVTKTPIRMVSGEKKDITEDTFNRSPMKIATYFMNPKGRADSVYLYEGPNSIKFDKHIFRYSQEGELIEIKIISATGKLMERTVLERTSKNELYLCKWQKDELKMEMKITTDSIIYETIWHRSSNSPTVRFTSNYNLEKDILVKATYHGEDWILKETYEWIVVNGSPVNFNYSIQTKGGSEKEKNENHALKVAEDGSVINKLNGLFTDPFSSCNYYKRHEIFKGIPDPHERLFTKESLIPEMEISEMLRFDGTHVIYLYSMDYK